MADKYQGLNFSQRNGLQPIPEQLKIGQISIEFRRLVHYAVDQEIKRVMNLGSASTYFTGNWKHVAEDLHVRVFGKTISSFRNQHLYLNRDLENRILKYSYDNFFN